MTKTKPNAARRLSQVHQHKLTLGIDGGGTKTLAVIADAAHQVLGEGTAGPSNPLRIGVGSAAAAIREAVDRACSAAGVQRSDILATQIGLAGVRREDVRQRMREALAGLRLASLELVTDGDIALFGATNGRPGVVVIAGTGSVCCGRNARGKYTSAGGWGPVAGDEGSGWWIARRGLQAVAQALDGRGPATSLTEAVCVCFNIATASDISTAIYAPSMTNERIASFGRCVVTAAQGKDKVARGIIVEAGRELGLAAVAVIRGLRMERERFQVAYVGGVFKAGEMILDPLRAAVERIAPKAFLAPPAMSPAVAATRMAHEHLHRLAVAV